MKEVKKLESLDLTKISIEDVRLLKNDVLRRALLEVISGVSRNAEHSSHGAHSNHYKTIAAPIISRRKTKSR